MDDPIVAESLLQFLRVDPQPGATTPILGEEQWTALIDQADRHQLAPLLHVRLKDDATLAPPIRTRLRQSFITAAARNFQLYIQLEQILAKLNDASIDIILLKGVYLAQEAYANIALRPMTDMDLLGRRNDLATIVRSLHDLGYTPEQEGSIEQQCKEAAHLPAMMNGNKYPIEVHWHIEGPDSPFKVDLDGLWQRRRPVEIGRQKTFALGAEDTLLHLCLHAARHARRDWFDEFVLKSLCDISRASCAALDWRAIEKRAADADATRAVFLMLTLAHDWLGANIPNEVLSRMRPANFDSRLLTWARTQIVCPMDAAPMGTHTAQLLGDDPLHKRAAILLRRLIPSPAEISKTYALPPNSVRIPFYYLVRIKDLIFRDAGIAIRLILGGNQKVGELVDRAAQGRALQQWLTSR